MTNPGGAFKISRVIVAFNTKGCFFTKQFGKHFPNEVRWKSMSQKCNDKLVLLGEILTRQFNFYTAQRIQRLTQITSLYQRLYTEHAIKRMVSRLATRWQTYRPKSFGFLIGISLFNWQKEKITDDEMKSCISEFESLSQQSRQYKPRNQCNVNENGQKSDMSWSVQQLNNGGWEPVISKENLHVWRKAVPGSYLYEYKVFGSFGDIPARAFFDVQIDTEYRKKWDKLVVKLDIIDKDEMEGNEVIHWVMHYPYPMYSRDYVYIRKSMIDQDNKVMVLMSRATDHPSCPADKKFVRVRKYFSQMVIRPHRNFDDTGFDYLLTYFDDPEAAFPAPAYNWMASTGVPDFVEKLHDAARRLFNQTPAQLASTNTNSIPNTTAMQQMFA